VFLESFAELEFCIQANHSSVATTTPSYSAPRRNLTTTPAVPDFSIGWNMVNVRSVMNVNWVDSVNNFRALHLVNVCRCSRYQMLNSSLLVS